MDENDVSYRRQLERCSVGESQQIHPSVSTPGCYLANSELSGLVSFSLAFCRNPHTNCKAGTESVRLPLPPLRASGVKLQALQLAQQDLPVPGENSCGQQSDPSPQILTCGSVMVR